MVKKSVKKGHKVAWIITIIVALILILFLLFGKTCCSTPEKTYYKYRAAFDKMNNFEDYEKIAKKYGTSSFANKRTEYKNSFSILSEDIRRLLINKEKSSSPSINELKQLSLNKQVSGNLATFTISNGIRTGSVTMIKQGKSWKVDKDEWRKA